MDRLGNRATTVQDMVANTLQAAPGRRAGWLPSEVFPLLLATPVDVRGYNVLIGGRVGCRSWAIPKASTDAGNVFTNQFKTVLHRDIPGIFPAALIQIMQTLRYPHLRQSMIYLIYLQITNLFTCRRERLRRICTIVEIQPRKRVPDHAGCTGPSPQH